MPRGVRNKLVPWIETLILNYGNEEASSIIISSVRLKAHVIAVGQMTQSQAQSSDGPTALLFLSDGAVQIPAVLTAAAWENIQEQEDRECFTSLLNTTVCVQTYRMRFHMAVEHTKCRFFLSVGELATTSAGPVQERTPCCTSLPSVRQKIWKTWKALLAQEDWLDSQKSQDGFDLTELLGAWQHECLQEVLQEVQELLRTARSRPVSPQPSTSSCVQPSLHADPGAATGWDVDRIKYKGEEPFSVPVKFLLIPEEEDAQQQQTPLEDESETPSGLQAASEDRKTDSPHASEHTGTSQNSVDDVEWRIARPGVLTGPHINESSPPPEESVLHEDMVAGMINSDTRLLSNPWDVFHAPCDTVSTSPSSFGSPESTAAQRLLPPADAESQPECAAILTSTQASVHKPMDFQTSEQSKGEHSFLPPYQKPPTSSGLAATATATATSSGPSASTAVDPLETPISRASNLSPVTDADETRQNLPPSDKESPIVEMREEVTVRKSRKAKRKRCELVPEALSTLEEEETGLSQSPPSWLFETQALSGSEGGSSQGVNSWTFSQKTPGVHSDGRTFSYSYQVFGQNLQDFSRFTVPDVLLQWAVKHLVPKQTENTPSIRIAQQDSSLTTLNLV